MAKDMRMYNPFTRRIRDVNTILASFMKIVKELETCSRAAKQEQHAIEHRITALKSHQAFLGREADKADKVIENLKSLIDDDPNN